MKNKLVFAFVAASILPLSSHAQLLVGAHMNTSISGTVEIELDSSFTVKEDIDTNSVSFYIGKQNSRNNYFLLGFDNFSMKIEGDSEKIKAKGLRLDAHFVYGEKQVKPYFGLGFGVYTSDDILINDDITGVSFQLMGGAKVELTEQLELDFALQSQAIAWQDVEVNNLGFGNTTMSIINSQVTLGAGIAYKF